MEKINGIIYKITNIINKKVYIGQTIQVFKERVYQHKYHSRKEKPKFLISRAIKKYGEENFIFETIDICDTREGLNKLESYYIALYDSTNKKIGYNVMEIQEGVIIYSEERRKKLSKIVKDRFIKNNNSEVRGRGLKNKNYTKFVGAYFIRGKYWIASICCDKKRHYIGSYENEIDAAMAYDIAALYFFGINAKLNFPNNKEKYLSGNLNPQRKSRRKK